MRKIKTKEIADLLGWTEQRVRVNAQSGHLPFGSYNMREGAYVGGYDYDPYLLRNHIGAERFDRYFGADFFEL